MCVIVKKKKKVIEDHEMIYSSFFCEKTIIRI
jgi:hypothetical protein